MRGDLSSLYDAHAARLYAYCWSLLGDEAAAAAVTDTFTAAVHQPPRGDKVLWLYSLSRSACADRGAFADHSAFTDRGAPVYTGADPLLRAAGGLRADQREVLLLWAGEWLETADIAHVLGIAPDTVAQLLHAARIRLERAVLDTLMRGTTEMSLELIAAFEKGRLPQLLARRSPALAPTWLREQVLDVCETEATRALPSVAVPSPLVVIGPPGAAGRTGRAGAGGSRAKRRVLGKGIGAVAGIAAAAAAAVGLLVSWPAAKSGGTSSLVPTAGHTDQSGQATPEPDQRTQGLTGGERSTGGAKPTSGNPVTSAFDEPPAPAVPAPGTPRADGGTTAPAKPSSPAPKQSKVGKTAAPEPGTSKPPDETSTPPDDGGTSPGGGGSTSPGSPSPTDPTTPTDPPTQDPEPSPSPTSNPTPAP
ncbi:RNA polymerase sigma factor [Actinomadura xylanilytica]|uniref:RNA polymerase sigma factor n=1 Tax=Actinomadura xylanilytica TaxID=887459 RepID=UPI00255AB2D3|nr:RNA polymerase sigma factor [Actinomadura xylanilytica]MDL4771832.1 RNA polymerase sigma factor [Actinomadura xylanilytica]